MNKLLLIIIIFLTYSLIQANDNEAYISKKILKIDKLIDKGNFVDGQLFLFNDTIKTKLLTFKGKQKTCKYLFCVSLDDKDSLKIYRSNEVFGYSINDEEFTSVKYNNETFFVKKLSSGRISLFERKGIPSDSQYLLFLKMPYYDNFFMINPFEKNIIEHKLPDSTKPESSGSTITYYQSKGINRQFKSFVSLYLGDCEKVKNMVKSDYYTIEDIPIIINTYNNCFN